MTLISNLCRSNDARWMSSSTLSAAGSSSKKAMSAQLSTTLAAMSQFALAFAVFRHRLEHSFAFQRTAQAMNIGARDWLQQDTVGRCGDCRFGSSFNLKLFAELARDHDLTLDGESDSFCLGQCIHDSSILRLEVSQKLFVG